MDYGKYDEYDWTPKGCVYFGEQLSAAGISLKAEEYNGSHQSELGAHSRNYRLPFFSSILEFE